MQTDIYDNILAENATRAERLRANYDPVTGEGLSELLGEKRVKLSIPDFAVPVQWVPEEMMKNPLIRAIARAGSIAAFIAKKKWHYGAPDPLDIERRIRRIRHGHDFCNWAFFCIKIQDKTSGGIIRFRLNYPQLIVLKTCEMMRKAGIPIDIIILKARQWGGSTFCIFYQTWIAFHHDEFHSFIIAAHVQSASETILQMLKDAVATYPAWDLGLPDGTQLRLAQRGQTGNAYVIKDQTHARVLETVFYIGSAEKPETLRSSNIHGAHYSEVGIWPNTPAKRPEALVATISGGITKRALDMQAMESTAKTSDDYFHDMWVAAMSGETNYRPVFIPWFYIPHDTIPFKDDREKDEFVHWLYDHREDENTDGKWRDAGKHYWWLWNLGATLEGINWYRIKRLDYTSYMQMANEAPSTATEAFMSAGMKVFDFYQVEEKRKKCREPLMRGDLTSAAFEGNAVLDDIYFIPRRDGHLKVWEEPDPSPIRDRYLVAVDIGGPRDSSDWSSVRVFDRLMMMPEFGGLSGRPCVVAEMHYHTDHDLLAYDAMRLAAWYNNALLVIESNTVETEAGKEADTGGEDAEYILNIVGDIYPNLYMRGQKEEKAGGKVLPIYGFQTNRFTKPKIINFMKACLREDRWDEPSELCLLEMGLYIQDKNKFTAPPKKHDDVLMATAIGLWICWNEMDVPSWIQQPTKQGRKVIEGDGSGLANL